MNTQFLNVSEILPESYANGPGCRTVIWVQGCSLACPGCFNPQTHSSVGGASLSVAELMREIAASSGRVEGITLTGGEPLQQQAPLFELLRRIKNETRLSVVVFTGYSWDETRELTKASNLLQYVDVLIAGRYIRTRHIATGLIGSSNKTIHFLTDRYNVSDFIDVPHAEVFIGSTGEIMVTGIDPPRL